MNTTTNTDYGALFKDTFTLAIKPENAIPLLVDALIVSVLSVCTLGLCAPALMLGYTQMALRAARGEKISMGESFQGFQQFVPALLLGLVLLVAVAIGSIVIVGGLVVMFVCTYSFMLLAAKPGLGPIEACTESWPLVRDHLVDTLVLWGFGLLVGTVLAPTGLGAVAVYAFSTLLSAVMFTRITNGQLGPGISISSR